MHKAFTLSPHDQLGLQAGCGCHGDGEGGLQWEQSNVPVGWGMPGAVAKPRCDFSQ